jgi:hypothetical protein
MQTMVNGDDPASTLPMLVFLDDDAIKYRVFGEVFVVPRTVLCTCRMPMSDTTFPGTGPNEGDSPGEYKYVNGQWVSERDSSMNNGIKIKEAEQEDDQYLSESSGSLDLDVEQEGENGLSAYLKIFPDNTYGSPYTPNTDYVQGDRIFLEAGVAYFAENARMTNLYAASNPVLLDSQGIDDDQNRSHNQNGEQDYAVIVENNCDNPIFDVMDEANDARVAKHPTINLDSGLLGTPPPTDSSIPYSSDQSDSTMGHSNHYVSTGEATNYHRVSFKKFKFSRKKLPGGTELLNETVYLKATMKIYDGRSGDALETMYRCEMDMTSFGGSSYAKNAQPAWGVPVTRKLLGAGERTVEVRMAMNTRTGALRHLSSTELGDQSHRHSKFLTAATRKSLKKPASSPSEAYKRMQLLKKAVATFRRGQRQLRLQAKKGAHQKQRSLESKTIEEAPTTGGASASFRIRASDSNALIYHKGKLWANSQSILEPVTEEELALYRDGTGDADGMLLLPSSTKVADSRNDGRDKNLNGLAGKMNNSVKNGVTPSGLAWSEVKARSVWEDKSSNSDDLTLYVQANKKTKTSKVKGEDGEEKLETRVSTLQMSTVVSGFSNDNIDQVIGPMEGALEKSLGLRSNEFTKQTVKIISVSEIVAKDSSAVQRARRLQTGSASAGHVIDYVIIVEEGFASLHFSQFVGDDELTRVTKEAEMLFNGFSGATENFVQEFNKVAAANGLPQLTKDNVVFTAPMVEIVEDPLALEDSAIQESMIDLMSALDALDGANSQPGKANSNGEISPEVGLLASNNRAHSSDAKDGDDEKQRTALEVALEEPLYLAVAGVAVLVLLISLYWCYTVRKLSGANSAYQIDLETAQADQHLSAVEFTDVELEREMKVLNQMLSESMQKGDEAASKTLTTRALNMIRSRRGTDAAKSQKFRNLLQELEGEALAVENLELKQALEAEMIYNQQQFGNFQNMDNDSAAQNMNTVLPNNDTFYHDGSVVQVIDMGPDALVERKLSRANSGGVQGQVVPLARGSSQQFSGEVAVIPTGHSNSRTQGLREFDV